MQIAYDGKHVGSERETVLCEPKRVATLNGDATTDAALRSWVPVAAESDFPIQNLPFGAAREGGGAHLCVAIGERALDLAVVAEHGLLDAIAGAPPELFRAPVLNPLLRAGRSAWRAVRRRLSQLLQAGDERIAERCPGALRHIATLDLVLAVDVPDYVDFYSSLEHASNAGAIFRPGADPLPPNWRHLPVGYHGRTGTLVIDGTPIVRPRGQVKAVDGPPRFEPTRRLDFELELGFVTGDGPGAPQRIRVDRARETIFGMCLLNDWSARDLQAWEAQPLGPFLAKSFATSLSPWLVMLDALEPFRVASVVQDPPPLAHLAASGDESYDISLEVTLTSAAMRAAGTPAQVLARSSFRKMYWTAAQQLAHAASNGASVRAGDLFGSGTISNAEPSSFGSLFELSWNGRDTIPLPDGSQRTFLEDGDEVTMRAWCEGGPGRARIGFGTVRGTIRAALPE